MSSPALQAHLGPAGKVRNDPPAFLPWDRSYCCCDCCIQVRDSLGVVAIHPVLKVSPQIKIWGVQIQWMRRPLRVTPAADQLVGGNTAVAMPMIRLRSGEWHHPARTTEGTWQPLSDSPSTKCCPELAKHLDISLGVDCHRPLFVVLEPEWSNDAMFGDGNPGSALHRV